MLYYVDTTIFNGLEALLLTHSNLQLRSCHQVTLHDIYDRWRTITGRKSQNLPHSLHIYSYLLINFWLKTVNQVQMDLNRQISMCFHQLFVLIIS